jgi:hypothetical protein
MFPVEKERDPTIQKLQNDVFAQFNKILNPNQPQQPQQNNNNLNTYEIEARDNIIKALEELKKFNAI